MPTFSPRDYFPFWSPLARDSNVATALPTVAARCADMLPAPARPPWLALAPTLTVERPAASVGDAPPADGEALTREQRQVVMQLGPWLRAAGDAFDPAAPAAPWAGVWLRWRWRAARVHFGIELPVPPWLQVSALCNAARKEPRGGGAEGEKRVAAFCVDSCRVRRSDARGVTTPPRLRFN